MEMNFREWVYDSAMGNMAKGYELGGIDNLFAPGSKCYCLYMDMLDAYQRLCNRLGEVDEDMDVEVIINSLLDICKEVGLQMYEYGAELGVKE